MDSPMRWAIANRSETRFLGGYFRIPTEIFKETRFLSWHRIAPRSRAGQKPGFWEVIFASPPR
ncbi:MAG: hypothetical protein GDA56_19675 [Hormoscilla sp. GM7CHS1pb]|nr:hypothetical protein [Hormoscilla sp. GM7CHS1pb]